MVRTSAFEFCLDNANNGDLVDMSRSFQTSNPAPPKPPKIVANGVAWREKPRKYDDTQLVNGLLVDV